MSKTKGYQCFTCWHQFGRVIAPDMKCPICGKNAYQTSKDWSEEWGSTRSEKRLKKERDEARAALSTLREACAEYLRLHDTDLDFEAGNVLEVIRAMIRAGDHSEDVLGMVEPARTYEQGKEDGMADERASILNLLKKRYSEWNIATGNEKYFGSMDDSRTASLVAENIKFLWERIRSGDHIPASGKKVGEGESQ